MRKISEPSRLLVLLHMSHKTGFDLTHISYTEFKSTILIVINVKDSDLGKDCALASDIIRHRMSTSFETLVYSILNVDLFLTF
jgi:hypothetical protein